MRDKPLSILLVDNEELILLKLKHILELSDYIVDIAYDGKEALKKIHGANYNVIISDIKMPKMDGLELLNRVRKTVDYQLPFILMTGYMDYEYALNAIRLGASDFIRKPIDTKLLLKSVNSVITGSKINEQFQNMTHQLQSAEMEFEFYPKHFLETDITTAIAAMFKQYFELNPYLVNEITLCLEEMLNNAFIHGTLKLEDHIRQMDYLNYKSHITKIIEDRKVSSKSILLEAKLNKRNKMIQLSVTDEGKGFDYRPWLELSEEEVQQNLTYHGRGIALIKLLADEIEFLNEGRTIMIRKKLEHASLELSEI